jgi:hypothetical protein
MNPPDQPTPRTDAECIQIYQEDVTGCSSAIDYVPASVARTLERKLAETERLRFGADADRLRLRAEVERLKGALTLGQQNCDDAYDDLREERDEAIARAEKAEAALAFIAENGGTTHETECGTISCNGLWCAEQARAAMKGTP